MSFETVSPVALKRIASAAISAAVGALLHTAHPIAIALTGAVPAIWLRQPSRLAAYGTACAYYAAAIWPVIPVVHRFNGSWLFGLCIWAGGLFVLSLPWLAFHSTKPDRAFWCGALATIASVVPPLGLIGVACPLSSAGFLFPACKVAGLFAACILPGLLAWKPKPAFALASAMVLLANVRYAAEPPHHMDWEGVDTIADTTPGAFGDYLRIQAMLNRAESSAARVIVFPEAYIRNWTTTTLTFFDDRIRSLREKGKTVLTGALIPEAAGYRNVVEAFGSTTTVFEQRVPVPLGMWHPLTREGVRLHLLAETAMHVAGQNVGVLVCYEQLITWPALATALNQPSVLVGIANEHWLRETPIEALQSDYVRAWSRLWDVPIVLAIAR